MKKKKRKIYKQWNISTKAKFVKSIENQKKNAWKEGGWKYKDSVA